MEIEVRAARTKALDLELSIPDGPHPAPSIAVLTPAYGSGFTSFGDDFKVSHALTLTAVCPWRTLLERGLASQSV